jgi:hypothetical protein
LEERGLSSPLSPEYRGEGLGFLPPLSPEYRGEGRKKT